MFGSVSIFSRIVLRSRLTKPYPNLQTARRSSAAQARYIDSIAHHSRSFLPMAPKVAPRYAASPHILAPIFLLIHSHHLESKASGSGGELRIVGQQVINIFNFAY
jgi:hypothetical protein